MNISDIVNGMFELSASLFVYLNIATLYKDKQVKGVSIIASSFFTIWGFANLYFYPHNGLMFSFYGGIGVVIANCIWVGQMIYYTYKDKKSFYITIPNNPYKKGDIIVASSKGEPLIVLGSKGDTTKVKPLK